MVFFNCDGCGESLKKNQVEKHSYRCRSQSYSCIDCQVAFTSQSYASHLKCISEDQKYGGKNFVAKENKGEAKQNAWIDQVERAIEAVRDPNLKQLLQRISGFGNIPRKEAKFINFLVNSIRIKNRDLCIQAWNAIAEEAKKIKEEEESAKKKLEEEQKPSGQNGELKEKEKKGEEEAGIANGETHHNGEQKEVASPFKWKKSIKRKLKEAGGEMKIKKLRKAVEVDFNAAGGDTNGFEALFEQKLAKAGVNVEGKTVSLAA